MHYRIFTEKFQFTDYQRHNVWAAMARAAEIADTKTKLPVGALLDCVATDFLATNAFGIRENPESQRQYLAKMERVLGKRLVLVNMETKQVEYGFDALEAIAQDEP
jgi:hypothetical protein